MRKLLQGVRIIDLSRALAGPYCSALLADLGADVIKVEAGSGGDSARSWPPFDRDGSSLYFASINRNKRSLSLDLRSEEGRRTLHGLLGEADVLLENFRPGTLSRMGFDPLELRRAYPRLVVASISGLGHVGPERNAAGLDQIAQGMSGLMSVTGHSEQEPLRVGIPIIDTVAGIFAALGIASALASRASTGEGAHLQTSLLESAVAIMGFQAQRFLSLGEVPSPVGNSHPTITPYGAFATRDEPINIAVGSEAQWHRLAEVLGEPSLPERDEFRDAATRLQNRDRLRVSLEALLSTDSSEEWITRIRDAGIPCGPIHRMDRVFDDAQIRALEVVRQAMLPDGSQMPLVRGPLWVDGEASDILRHPPRLGEHSREILEECGIETGQIDKMFAQGTIPVTDSETSHA